MAGFNAESENMNWFDKLFEMPTEPNWGNALIAAVLLIILTWIAKNTPHDP